MTEKKEGGVSVSGICEGCMKGEACTGVAVVDKDATAIRTISFVVSEISKDRDRLAKERDELRAQLAEVKEKSNGWRDGYQRACADYFEARKELEGYKTADKDVVEDSPATAVGKGNVAFGWTTPATTPATFPKTTQPEPKKPSWIPRPGEAFELRGLTYCRAEEGSVAAELANDEQFAAKNIETGNDIWVRLDAEHLEPVREAVQRNDEEPSTSESTQSPAMAEKEWLKKVQVLTEKATAAAEQSMLTAKYEKYETEPTKPWIPEPGEAWKYKGRSEEVYIRLKTRLDHHAEGRFSSVRPGQPNWARYGSTALDTPNLEPVNLNEDVDMVG